MSGEFLRHTADVLEKLAEYLDHQETASAQALSQERHTIAAELNEKIAAVTGEALSADALERLVQSEPQIALALVKLAERQRQTESPDELGSPGDLDEGNTAFPRSKTAAVHETKEQAESRFLDWILS